MPKPLIGLNTNPIDDKGTMAYSVRHGYADAIAENGGTPALLPCTTDPSVISSFLDALDGFLLIGGRDYPADTYGMASHPEDKPLDPVRVRADMVLGPMLLERGFPLLAICGGHQLLNIVRGGRLIQHLDQAERHTDEKYHSAKITGGRLLCRIFDTGELRVNSSHHQAVDPNAVGKGFEIVARADDDTVEAMEQPGDRFVLGVQWHPERIDDPDHIRKLFGAFAEACSAKPR